VDKIERIRGRRRSRWGSEGSNLLIPLDRHRELGLLLKGEEGSAYVDGGLKSRKKRIKKAPSVRELSEDNIPFSKLRNREEIPVWE